MQSRILSWKNTLRKLGFTQNRRKNLPKNGFARSLRVEGLEDRRMLAITVMNLNDSGSGSLRAAIAAAPPSETIDFHSSLNGGTINLASTLLINKSLTIDASALTNGITIDAGNGTDGIFATGDGFRIFNIDDGDDNTNQEVIVRGLTLTGGDAFQTGGAIHSRENLMIVDSIISGNAAVVDYEKNNPLFNGFIRGGGIYSSSDHFVIVNSIISNNIALSDNSPEQVEAANGNTQGGGIFVIGQEVTIERTKITGNTAKSDFRLVGTAISQYGPHSLGTSYCLGGGVYVQSKQLSIVECEFSSNSVINDFDGARIEVGDSTIQSQGGGLFFMNPDILGTNPIVPSIQGSTFSNNKVAIVGSLEDESTMLLNLAEGAGIFSYRGPLEILSSTISGNVSQINLTGPNDLATGTWSRGAGIFVYPGTTTIKYSTISQNVAALTAPIGTLNVKNEGGGLYNYGDVDLSHVILSGNSISDGDLSSGSFVADDYSGTSSSSINAIYSLISDGSVSGIGVISGDPKLGPLQGNSGFSFLDGTTILTHAILSDSPAKDAGNPSLVAGVGGVPEFDQRGSGFIRIINEIIDMGAFEFGAGADDCDSDFDGDGDVDGRDFLIWQRGFGLTGQTDNSNGDADGNGVVDGEDLACWQEHYGTTGMLVAQQLIADDHEEASASLVSVISSEVNSDGAIVQSQHSFKAIGANVFLPYSLRLMGEIFAREDIVSILELSQDASMEVKKSKTAEVLTWPIENLLFKELGITNGLKPTTIERFSNDGSLYDLAVDKVFDGL
jgi:hypothetical protein